MTTINAPVSLGFAISGNLSSLLPHFFFTLFLNFQVLSVSLSLRINH